MNNKRNSNNNAILPIVLASVLTFFSGVAAVSLAFKSTLSPEQKDLCHKSAEVSKVGGLTVLELLKKKKDDK